MYDTGPRPSDLIQLKQRTSLMSALGQKPTFCIARATSALPPKADISWRQSNVCRISAALVVGNVGKHLWVLLSYQTESSSRLL